MSDSSWNDFMQGRLFLKIQPTTICGIELTPDQNQAKHSEGKVWAKNRPFLNSANHNGIKHIFLCLTYYLVWWSHVSDGVQTCSLHPEFKNEGRI